MKDIQEKELIGRAKKDPQAFGEIFDKYYDPIFGYILKRIGDVHVSQDIVSSTFFKALDRLWQFRWKGISISSWLYKIATNEINQYFRNNKHSAYSLETLIEERGFELPADIDLLEEVIEQERELSRAWEWKKMRAYIERLPEKYQEVLALRYFEDKKISEISEILNKKEGTVKSLLSRAVEKLRRVSATKNSFRHSKYEEGNRRVDLPL